MKMKRLFLIILVVVLTLLCAGGVYMFLNLRSDKSEQVTDSSGAYTVYYADADKDELKGLQFQPTATTFEGILDQLLQELQKTPDDTHYSIFKPDIHMNGTSYGVDNLTVDFNASYLSLDSVDEILLRAGLVRTLAQLPGILKVSITVDGQPLTDNSGENIGPMNEETFIDTGGQGINSFSYANLGLYFSNGTGDKTVKEDRRVFYSTNLIMERVIVEQLIRGPGDEKHLALTSPDAKILDVTVQDKLCIVNMDSNFNQVYNDQVKPETILQAFANSICEESDVNGVQFEIEGASDVRFLGQVSLDQIFKRDPESIDVSIDKESTTEK